MKRLIGVISTLALLVLLCTGVFSNIPAFFSWLFMLQQLAPETSVVGSIVVRLLTFAVSYSLTGLIFSVLGLFESRIMSVVYFVVSTLFGFAIAYVVRSVEQNALLIIVILSVVFVASISLVIFLIARERRKMSGDQHNLSD